MADARDHLVSEVIDLIIDSLNLHFVRKEELGPDTAMMADVLGLDSVDILEVVVAIERQYKVKVLNAEQGKQVFRTIGTICDFILASQGTATAVQKESAVPVEA
jgi:acyl carrier protein